MVLRIFVAGHRGMVGSALVRALTAAGGCELLQRTREQLDLRDQAGAFSFLAQSRPDEIYLGAATVGGIHANDTRRGEFIYDNLLVAANVIEGARRTAAPRLLFHGSSCIYPRLCPQPMREEHLLSGALEQTNEPYAIAKIAGPKLIESYNRQYGTHGLSGMPTNLYGPADNYDLACSHVLPAMIRKFHAAKISGDQPVTVWSSGTPRRELLHVDDLAAACLLVMERGRPGQFPGDMVNIGSDVELVIADLARLVHEVIGHCGAIVWDSGKPDGTLRKLRDCIRIHALGWRPVIALRDGIAAAYAAFLTLGQHARGVG